MLYSKYVCVCVGRLLNNCHVFGRAEQSSCKVCSVFFFNVSLGAKKRTQYSLGRQALFCWFFLLLSSSFLNRSNYSMACNSYCRLAPSWSHIKETPEVKLLKATLTVNKQSLFLGHSIFCPDAYFLRKKNSKKCLGAGPLCSHSVSSSSFLALSLAFLFTLFSTTSLCVQTRIPFPKFILFYWSTAAMKAKNWRLRANVRLPLSLSGSLLHLLLLFR